MCAIGRGLMGRPRLLLIDELSLGLAPLVVDNLLELISRDQPEGNDRAARRAGRPGRARARAPRLRAGDRADRPVGPRAGAAARTRGSGRRTWDSEESMAVVSPGTTRGPASPGRIAAIGALNFATVAVYSDLYITQPILPLLSREFDVAPATAGLTISVVVLMIALVSSAYGSLSDAVGRKPVMVASCVLLAVPTLLCAVARRFHMLLVFRALQGLLMPGVTAVAVAYHRRSLQRGGPRPEGRRLDRGLGRRRADRPRPVRASSRRGRTGARPSSSSGS